MVNPNGLSLHTPWDELSRREERKKERKIDKKEKCVAIGPVTSFQQLKTDLLGWNVYNFLVGLEWAIWQKVQDIGLSA